MDNMVIARRLVELRGDKKQAVVAKAVGIGDSTLSMYESGRRIPKDIVKVKLADYYNTTVQAIFFA